MIKTTLHDEPYSISLQLSGEGGIELENERKQLIEILNLVQQFNQHQMVIKKGIPQND